MEVAKNLDVKVKATALRDLMKNASCSHQQKMEVIAIISTLNWKERVEVAKYYEAHFGLKVTQEFERHFHQGSEHKLFDGLFEHRYEFWAEQINQHLSNQQKLIQLILLASDHDFEAISEAYLKKYQKSIRETISNKLGTKDWNKLLRGWMSGQNAEQTDPRVAAEMLHHKHDDDTFISVMCNCTHATYKAIDKCYCELFHKDKYPTLRELIIHEFTFDSEFAFLLCHDYLLDPAVAVASALRKATKGITDEENIINITVLFCDYLKGEKIKKAYFMYEGKDIVEELKFDLVGKFESSVLAMWGLGI